MTRSRTLSLVLPACLLIVVFMVMPLMIAVVYSFMTADSAGGVERPLTFDSYVQFLFERDFDGTLQFSTDYGLIILRSVVVSVLTTVICLAIALPVTWYVVCRPPQRRRLLILVLSMPFWINMLIRTYCWVLILRDEGLVNQALQGVGLTSSPLRFLYNDGAVLLGQVYTFLPFMVLPLYATLERLDQRLVEAAHDLYADRLKVFWRIVWPLAKPGAIAGSILVFAPALGAFLAPDILGGGRTLYLGNLIQMQFSSSRNWPFGSALAVVISVVVVLAYALQIHRSERRATRQPGAAS